MSRWGIVPTPEREDQLKTKVSVSFIALAVLMTLCAWVTVRDTTTQTSVQQAGSTEPTPLSSPESATPTTEEAESESTPAASSTVYQFQYRGLTLGLTGWKVEGDIATKISQEGRTELSFHKSFMVDSPAAFVQSYNNCRQTFTHKGNARVGNRLAWYFEGTGCGTDETWFDRVWYIPGKRFHIVASSDVRGDVNGLDQIMFKYAGWEG